ncbi:unnamed protein product [Orchesella dallaii]|uniref:Uncharacterized protein n=1 Tax=Orchesella dallaii TaxID=48710 RepID=A0ABP1S4C4_9HEXA
MEVTFLSSNPVLNKNLPTSNVYVTQYFIQFSQLSTLLVLLTVFKVITCEEIEMNAREGTRSRNSRRNCLTIIDNESLLLMLVAPLIVYIVLHSSAFNGFTFTPAWTIWLLLNIALAIISFAMIYLVLKKAAAVINSKFGQEPANFRTISLLWTMVVVDSLHVPTPDC